MDRRSFLGTILLGLMPGRDPVQVKTHPNPCERSGFHRCWVRMIRGFCLADCDVKLPFGVYITDIRIEFSCMKTARDILAIKLSKRNAREIEDALKCGLVEAVNGRMGFDWFYLRSMDENWQRSSPGYWMAELWATKSFDDTGIRIADVIVNKILEDEPVPEMKP